MTSSVLDVFLQGLHMRYDTLASTLPIFKPTVRPVASRRLFFDIQVVTLLLGEYCFFARASLYYSTTRLPHIF